MTLHSFGGWLHPFWNEMGRLSLPTTVLTPQVQNAGFAEDGQQDNERVGGKNLTKLCEEELQWNVVAKEGL